ncbi:MAG: hypothetical protein AAB383_02975 [Patescibacteria group bacterium]
MNESCLEEIPEVSTIICAPLVFPVCADFEEEFLGAIRRPWLDIVPVTNVSVHVLLEIRGVLGVVTRIVPKVYVNRIGTVKSGVIQDDVLGGCIAAPCGRNEDFSEKNFVLARSVGETRLGADDYLDSWLLSQGITSNEGTLAKMEFRAKPWVESWKAISRLGRASSSQGQVFAV